MSANIQVIEGGLNVDTESWAGDEMAITETARYVRTRLGENNSAKIWIEVGRVYADLHAQLVRPSPRSNSKRIGWVAAFKKGEKNAAMKMPVSRPTADKLIAVHDFFNVHVGTLKNLPASWRTLYLIATKFDHEALDACLADGRITTASTESEVRRVGKDIGVIVPKPPSEKFASTGEEYRKMLKALRHKERVKEIRSLIAEFGLTREDLLND